MINKLVIKRPNEDEAIPKTNTIIGPATSSSNNSPDKGSSSPSRAQGSRLSQDDQLITLTQAKIEKTLTSDEVVGRQHPLNQLQNVSSGEQQKRVLQQQIDYLESFLHQNTVVYPNKGKKLDSLLLDHGNKGGEISIKEGNTSANTSSRQVQRQALPVKQFVLPQFQSSPFKGKPTLAYQKTSNQTLPAEEKGGASASPKGRQAITQRYHPNSKRVLEYNYQTTNLQQQSQLTLKRESSSRKYFAEIDSSGRPFPPKLEDQKGVMETSQEYQPSAEIQISQQSDSQGQFKTESNTRPNPGTLVGSHDVETLSTNNDQVHNKKSLMGIFDRLASLQPEPHPDPTQMNPHSVRESVNLETLSQKNIVRAEEIKDQIDQVKEKIRKANRRIALNQGKISRAAGAHGSILHPALGARQLARKRTINYDYTTGPQGHKRFNYTKDILIEQKKRLSTIVQVEQEKPLPYRIPDPQYQPIQIAADKTLPFDEILKKDTHAYMEREKTEARKKKWDSLFSNNSQANIQHHALTPALQPPPLATGNNNSAYMMFAPKSKGMILHLKNHLKKPPSDAKSNFLRLRSPKKDQAVGSDDEGTKSPGLSSSQVTLKNMVSPEWKFNQTLLGQKESDIRTFNDSVAEDMSLFKEYLKQNQQEPIYCYSKRKVGRQIGLTKWRNELHNLQDLFNRPLKDKRLIINMDRFFEANFSPEQAFHETEIGPEATTGAGKETTTLVTEATSRTQMIEEKSQAKLKQRLHIKKKLNPAPEEPPEVPSASLLMSRRANQVDKDWSIITKKDSESSLHQRDFKVEGRKIENKPSYLDCEPTQAYSSNVGPTGSHYELESTQNRRSGSKLSLQAEIFYRDTVELMKKKKELNIKDYNLVRFQQKYAPFKSKHRLSQATSSDSYVERMAFTNVLIKSGISSNDGRGEIVTNRTNSVNKESTTQPDHPLIQNQETSETASLQNVLEDKIQATHPDQDLASKMKTVLDDSAQQIAKKKRISFHESALQRSYTPKRKQSENQIFKIFKAEEKPPPRKSVNPVISPFALNKASSIQKQEVSLETSQPGASSSSPTKLTASPSPPKKEQKKPGVASMAEVYDKGLTKFCSLKNDLQTIKRDLHLLDHQLREDRRTAVFKFEPPQLNKEQVQSYKQQFQKQTIHTESSISSRGAATGGRKRAGEKSTSRSKRNAPPSQIIVTNHSDSSSMGSEKKKEQPLMNLNLKNIRKNLTIKNLQSQLTKKVISTRDQMAQNAKEANLERLQILHKIRQTFKKDSDTQVIPKFVVSATLSPKPTRLAQKKQAPRTMATSPPSADQFGTRKVSAFINEQINLFK